MTITVFYSWQSDLPNSTNRSFIETALERAAKQIQVDIPIIIDRDTSGVPGSPNIATTIYDKIDMSDIFVCDVSIINPDRTKGSRATPNPNVLLELGYAIKVLGWKRIILVINNLYGSPEELPFDLRMNRVIQYKISESDQDKASERTKLQNFFQKAIHLISQTISSQTQIPKEQINLNDKLQAYNLNDLSSQNFADIFTFKLIDFDPRGLSGNKTIPSEFSTVFLAIPSHNFNVDSSNFYKTVQEMVDPTRWYSWNSTEKNAPGSRYFAAKIFPLNNSTSRIEQNAIVIEDTDSNNSGAYFILRINSNGDVSYASSYQTTTRTRDNKKVFHLGRIVQLFWSYLCVVKELQEQLNYDGNYHLVVALKNAKGAFLGGFANKRPDVLQSNYIRGPEMFNQICSDLNVLITRENVDLQTFEKKVLPAILKDIANELSRVFNYSEAYCFEKETGNLPDEF